jgi:hypothetical protein
MTGTAGKIEKVRVLVSVPAVFDALIVAVLLPEVVGVPLITPLVPLRVGPAGRLVAPKVLGRFSALIR